MVAKWDGHTERRKDMGETIERLVRLETLQEKDIIEATDWRKLFCGKVEEIKNDVKSLLDKFILLPCKERKGWYQSMGRQVGFMWAVLALILAAVLGSGYIAINRVDQIKDVLSGINQRLIRIELAHNIEPK